MKRILVIGGGASGLLVLINIAQMTSERVDVVVAEPRLVLGKGIAYSTKDGGHLLNVPASRMSALVSDPDHFMQWGNFDSNTFALRSDYGKYLLDTFVQLQGQTNIAQFEHRRATVESLVFQADSVEAKFDNEETVEFDIVVIAVGHGDAIGHPALESFVSHPNVVMDSWQHRNSLVDGTLVCLGTGLTFIDHALSHLRRNSNNTVIGISRTGLIPESHLAQRAAPIEVPASARTSPLTLRDFITGSSDWRAAQDGVRHELPDIWFAWSDAAKSEFLTDHLRWWNVHRHRVAPEIATEVNDAIADSRIQVLKGDVLSILEIDKKLNLEVSGVGEITADLIINCLGYRTPGSSKLFVGLAEAGITSPGPLGLGISTNYPSFNVINQNGEVLKNLYALGPILFGERFETTAIPELRVQAHEIARSISIS
jgi:uncharacterized NAD(P)/FAD-binding protein YdhS